MQLSALNVNNILLFELLWNTYTSAVLTDILYCDMNMSTVCNQLFLVNCNLRELPSQSNTLVMRDSIVEVYTLTVHYLGFFADNA